MSVAELFEPILTGGVHNTNFFNGRLLTAEDLRTEQEANRQQHWQLGRAVGEGVAYGFDVKLAVDSTAERPILHVGKGLAINRKGEAVALALDTNVALVREKEVEAAEAGLFAECVPPQEVPINPGLYVLTVMPTSGFEGWAPMTELGTEGVATGCGRRFAVEGVKFRLLRLNLGSGEAGSTLRSELVQLATKLNTHLTQLPFLSGAQADQLRTQINAEVSKLRNGVAHLCFGTEKLATFSADPFARIDGKSPFVSYGLLDELREQDILTECEVPLALLHWTRAGVQFIDLWSVRRPLVPSEPSDLWSPIIGNRRAAEGLAMFLQFQEHIEQLTVRTLPQSDLGSAEAAEYFRYLPAAGMIPVTISSIRQYYKEKAGKVPDGLTGQESGFDYRMFFKNMTFRDPVFIEGAKVGHIIRESFMYPPVYLGSKEMIWLYLIRENVESIITDGISPPKVCMIFTNGHMPFNGEARFDLSRWDYSNYASVWD